MVAATVWRSRGRHVPCIDRHTWWCVNLSLLLVRKHWLRHRAHMTRSVKIRKGLGWIHWYSLLFNVRAQRWQGTKLLRERRWVHVARLLLLLLLQLQRVRILQILGDIRTCRPAAGWVKVGCCKAQFGTRKSAKIVTRVIRIHTRVQIGATN